MGVRHSVKPPGHPHMLLRGLGMQLPLQFPPACVVAKAPPKLTPDAFDAQKVSSVAQSLVVPRWTREPKILVAMVLGEQPHVPVIGFGLVHPGL